MLVGEGLGGFVAWLFAAYYPRLARGLVVVGAIISEFAKFTISSSVAGLVDTDGDTVRCCRVAGSRRRAWRR